MKVTLLLGLLVVCSVSDAWYAPRNHLSDSGLWNLLNQLFPPTRPVPPPILIAPDILPPEEPHVTETVPYSPSTQHIPDFTTVTETVTPCPTTKRTEPIKVTRIEPTTTRTEPTTLRIEYTEAIVTEPTPKRRVDQGLRQEVLRVITQILDILLTLPKNVSNRVSVLLPILGNVIDIISEKQ